LKPTSINDKSKWPARFFYLFNNWFERVTQHYSNGVKRSIKASKFIVILLICICLGAYFMFRSKPTGFIPPEDDGRLYITFQLPEAASTAQSVEMLTRLMNIAMETPGMGHTAA